ncbi:hypothetical protein [Aliarcobacter cryaerophilus]|uniref:hypothetical protein n=1 Tax=Aliarcobacter cryaerophilus TaxID=28198 RepID=UPI003DA3CBA2
MKYIISFKYPIYLFLSLIILKMIYIGFESYYNYYLLFTTTSVDILTKEKLEELNHNGHILSAIGISLLFIPILYLICKKIQNSVIKYLFLLILFFLTFISSYHLLNKTVDYIVEVNEEKRHDAYYIGLFKYGLLKKHFNYDSFIKYENIQNDQLSINDRILLTNSFLLLYSDKDLINKLKQRGYERAPYIYIDKNIDKFNLEYETFNKISNEIDSKYKEFTTAKKILQENIKEIKKFNNDEAISEDFNKFINKIKEDYNSYKSNYNIVISKIEEETTYKKLSETKNKLENYFSNKNKYEKEYIKATQDLLGKYIEPNKWLDRYGEISLNQIKNVIINEISSGLPYKENSKMLTFEEFKNTQKVREAVFDNLNNRGIVISKYGFNYSKEEFKISYINMLNNKINNLYKTFDNELIKKLGKNDLHTDTTWNDFLNSKYLRNILISKLNIKADKEYNDIINILKSDNRKEKFKEIIYIPKIKQEINKIFFTKDQFSTDALAIEIGKDAVKMLYIPPLALAISILALLLNIITVVGLLLEINKVPRLLVLSLKIGIFLFIILLPIFSSYDGFNNELIRKEADIKITNYINFLNWLSYYQQLNVKLYN